MERRLKTKIVGELAGAVTFIAARAQQNRTSCINRILPFCAKWQIFTKLFLCVQAICCILNILNKRQRWVNGVPPGLKPTINVTNKPLPIHTQARFFHFPSSNL